MFQHVTDSTQIDGEIYWLLESGKLVTAFKVVLTDVETADLNNVESAYSQFLKTLRPDVLLRVWLCSAASSEVPFDHSRRFAIESLGHVASKLFFIFESDAISARDFLNLFRRRSGGETPLLGRAREMKSGFDLSALRAAGVAIQPVAEDEFNSLLIKSNTTGAIRLPCAVDLGHSVSGSIRLNRLASSKVNVLSLANLKDVLPLPFEIKISLRKLDADSSESLLRRKLSQVSSSSERIAQAKFQEAESALEDVSLHGGSLFKAECLISISRKSEQDVRSDANFVVQILKPLGDWYFETIGAVPSFFAASIGYDQHITFLESHLVVPSYLPVWSYGSTGTEKKVAKRALFVHRRDQSLTSIDLFDPSYDNFSACIFGRSGKGKSVLTNLLTRALHFDESIRITKIDVGGSHSKETKLLGGVERSLSLTQPSGINPFSVFKNAEHSEDICNVVTSFLNVLLLEEGESFLLKEMRGQIERCVGDYSLSRPLTPSVSDFYLNSPELPRRGLLERWTDRGIYRNAFKEIQRDDHTNKSNRLCYFNFSQIFQAKDPDFGQGGLAAVMAQFNFDLIQRPGEKFVFIADETPFFIERCFSFFKFSTANVRKFGGSFVTVAQTSSDVVVGGDSGIIDNSAQKFIFSIDGARESFGRRLKFSDAVLDRIEGLSNEKGIYSEVLFSDAHGSRVLRVQLSAEEHWSVTSRLDQTAQLQSLLDAVPGLSLEGAIRCLSI